MKTKSKIIFVSCKDYRPLTVAEAFSRIETLAAKHYIPLPKGQSLILKPNMLAGDPPEKAVTTHPEIFKNAARLFRKTGNTLFYADSPGMGEFARIAKITGLEKAALDENVTPFDFSEEKELDFPDGKFVKKFFIAKNLTPEYKIINLPKLKTHGQMLYTGCIKNIFGVIPGERKPEAHLKMLSTDNFAKMIVDIYRYVNPVFTIMDAVIGQEGNGPRAGAPRQLGFIIAGTDSLAIDSICVRIIGLAPHSVPILKYGAEFEIGNIGLENIEVIGDDWEAFQVKDFKNIVSPSISGFIGPGVIRLMKKFFFTRPAVHHKECIGCEKCIEKCPLKSGAIYMKDKKIRYDYSLCIRCFCCQEVCPEGAIYVSENKFFKTLFALITKIYKLLGL